MKQHGQKHTPAARAGLLPTPETGECFSPISLLLHSKHYTCEQGRANPARQMNWKSLSHPPAAARRGPRSLCCSQLALVFQFQADLCPLRGRLLCFTLVYRALLHRVQQPRDGEARPGASSCHNGPTMGVLAETQPNPPQNQAAAGEIPPQSEQTRWEKGILEQSWEALGWRGCSFQPCPSHGAPGTS